MSVVGSVSRESSGVQYAFIIIIISSVTIIDGDLYLIHLRLYFFICIPIILKIKTYYLVLLKQSVVNRKCFSLV